MAIRIRSQLWRTALTVTNWLLVVIGAAAFLYRWGLQTQYIYLPKEPDAVTGQIMAYSFKGAVFYMTEYQYGLDYALLLIPYACIVMLIAAVLLFGSETVNKIIERSGQ
ncbi:hypothetical protein AB4Z01_02070 [Inquilinus sp. YAF38]|uniref:hypothetical protein n=1 Tax=Inquilinus sp. YAF38 TaxID=3233084 RepID=UPI003F90EFD0